MEAAAGAATAGSGTTGASGGSSATVGGSHGADVHATSTSTTDNQPPLIKINGDNPAHIGVGGTYADLGATITGPQEDLNLGIHLYIDNAVRIGAGRSRYTARGTHRSRSLLA